VGPIFTFGSDIPVRVLRLPGLCAVRVCLLAYCVPGMVPDVLPLSACGCPGVAR